MKCPKCGLQDQDRLEQDKNEVTCNHCDYKGGILEFYTDEERENYDSWLISEPQQVTGLEDMIQKMQPVLHDIIFRQQNKPLIYEQLAREVLLALCSSDAGAPVTLAEDAIEVTDSFILKLAERREMLADLRTRPADQLSLNDENQLKILNFLGDATTDAQ